MILPSLYRLSVSQLIDSESDIMNKVRAKTCIDAVLATLLVMFFVCIVHPSSGIAFLLSKSFLFFFTLLVAFLLILKFRIWRTATHTILIFNSLMVYSDVYFPQTTPDLVLSQHAFITVFLSFFFVSYFYAVLYSVVVLVGFAIVILHRDAYHMPSFENSLSSFFVTVFSLYIIIFVFYRFLTTLYRLINEAEDSIEQGKVLTQKLEETAASSRSTADAKNEFFSTISQGLRTPLNAIIGFTNLIIQKNQTEPADAEKLDLMLFSAESLMALVNDLIDYNQFDRGKFRLEKDPVKLFPLITKIKNGLKIKADKKWVVLDLIYDQQLDDLVVNLDATRFTQVIYNLTDNAIKFTPKGKVDILVNVLESSPNEICLQFEVRDTGIGIPANRVEAIFAPFIQASDFTTREFGGTGLGLTIVENVLKAMGSVVECISEVGVGTSFIFNLKLQKVEAVMNKTTDTQDLTPLLRGRRVLVVDDNDMNNVLMSRVLTNWEIHFDIVLNGQQALNSAMLVDYDLILMDINMPVMDGLESSKRIKEQKPYQKIVLLTADAQYHDQKYIETLGLEGFMIKPFNVNDLKCILLTHAVIKSTEMI